MTAILAGIRRDCAYIASDLGFMIGEHSGQLAGFRSKTRAIPHLKMAAAVRGNNMILDVFEAVAGFVDDIDELAAHLVEPMRSGVASLLSFHPDVSLDYFELLFAGWSPRQDAFRIFTLASQPFLLEGGGELAPWEVRPFSGRGHVMLPWSSDCERRLRTNDPAAVAALQQLSTERLVITLMEQQRLMTSPDYGPSATGGIQLTQIYFDGIEARIIHRWPDRLGEPVDR